MGAGLGRPFIVAGAERTAEPTARPDWCANVDTAVVDDRRMRRALAQAWLRDALLEHASIASFAKLTLQLLSLGAPPDLVTGSQRAALDEVEHAKLCFAVASRYAGANLGPGALPMGGEWGGAHLTEVAVGALREGCIGETLAALVASQRAEHARDRVARSVLGRIARDEARHATLSWEIVRWALEEGGAPTRGAITRTLAEELRQVGQFRGVSHESLDTALWSAHGRLTSAEELEICRSGTREVIDSCARALGIVLGPTDDPPTADG